MKVKFTITFDCEYDIPEDDEDWMEEDDGKYEWNEDFAIDRLMELIRDDPEEYATEHAVSRDISEIMKIRSR